MFQEYFDRKQVADFDQFAGPLLARGAAIAEVHGNDNEAFSEWDFPELAGYLRPATRNPEPGSGERRGTDG